MKNSKLLEKKGFFAHLIEWVMLLFILIVSATGNVEALEFTKKPYLQHVTQTSIIICWETDEAAAAEIRYGKTKALKNIAKLPVEKQFHEVRLQGLEPETDYYFIAGAGELKHRGTFSTAPRPDTPFRAIVYGDFRFGPVENSLNKKMMKKKPDVFITVGDYLSDGKNEELWPHLFRTIEPIIKRVPYYVSLGNHENDGPLYFKYFAMPGNERWYSFDYGNIHFIALDSNGKYLAMPEQAEWLEADIKAARENPGVSFVIPFFHHPPYGTGKRHGNRKVIEMWVPIFEKYNVAAVFSGHEHHYERCVVNGITYIITGGGGAGLYEFAFEEEYSKFRSSRYHYVILDVEKGLIKAKAVALEGEVMDTFEIKK